MMRCATILLLLCVPMWAGASELSADQQQDLDELRGKIERVGLEIGREPTGRVALGLSEASDWVEEFIAGAKLAKTDPIAVELHGKLGELRERFDKARMAKREPAAKSAPARPASQALEELLKVDVDLKNVSFKRDVAPIIAESCLRCHSGARPSGEFDASTFAKFREQITPGKPDDSHIIALVTGKEQPRMPRGGAGFSPEALAIWSAWIEQGAKFDGTGPSVPITAYLVDTDAKRREKISRLPISEVEELHRVAANRQMDIVRPKTKVSEYESPRFLVRTTLESADAEYVAVLAEAILEELFPKWKVPSDPPLWPGRLGLIVFRDRYDYVAFARQIDNDAPEDDQTGHGRARPEFSYLVVSGQEKDRSLDFAVAHQVLEAVYRTIGEGKMPDWAVHGSALSEVPSWDPAGAPIVKAELKKAAEVIDRTGWSGSLFDGNLPWIEAAPLATSLFHFLAAEHKRKLIPFQLALASGQDAKSAISAVLEMDDKTLTAAWYAWAVRKHRR